MTLPDLAATASRLLKLVEQTAADHDVHLPPRRYITAGLSGAEVWDTEQVVVGLVMLEPQQAVVAGEQLGASFTDPGRVSLPAAVLRAEIVRGTPTMPDTLNGELAMTDVDDEHAAGVQAMIDAALLHRVRARVMSEGALTDGEPADVRLGNIVPSGPESGLAGMSLTVAVTLV